MKYNTALDGRQSMNLYTTTNQKQVAATEGDYGGEARRAGGAGKRDIIVFGGGRSQRRVENLNKSFSLDDNFFLSRFI